MNYSNITFIQEHLQRIASEEVAQLEAHLETKMPVGYQTFITTFGVGFLHNTINNVQVYPPSRIAHDLGGFQERWDTYWHWDDGKHVLSKDRVISAIIIADTSNGDELIFHPSEPERLYVLPIDSTYIFEVGSSLDDAINWILYSGVLDDPLDDANQAQQVDKLFFDPLPDIPQLSGHLHARISRTNHVGMLRAQHRQKQKVVQFPPIRPKPPQQPTEEP